MSFTVLVIWLLAAGMYPVGLMLGAPCSKCCGDCNPKCGNSCCDTGADEVCCTFGGSSFCCSGECCQNDCCTGNEWCIGGACIVPPCGCLPPKCLPEIEELRPFGYGRTDGVDCIGFPINQDYPTFETSAPVYVASGTPYDSFSKLYLLVGATGGANKAIFETVSNYVDEEVPNFIANCRAEGRIEWECIPDFYVKVLGAVDVTVSGGDTQQNPPYFGFRFRGRFEVLLPSECRETRLQSCFGGPLQRSYNRIPQKMPVTCEFKENGVECSLSDGTKVFGPWVKLDGTGPAEQVGGCVDLLDSGYCGRAEESWQSYFQDVFSENKSFMVKLHDNSVEGNCQVLACGCGAILDGLVMKIKYLQEEFVEWVLGAPEVDQPRSVDLSCETGGVTYTCRLQYIDPYFYRTPKGDIVTAKRFIVDRFDQETNAHIERQTAILFCDSGGGPEDEDLWMVELASECYPQSGPSFETRFDLFFGNFDCGRARCGSPSGRQRGDLIPKGRAKGIVNALGYPVGGGNCDLPGYLNVELNESC